MQPGMTARVAERCRHRPSSQDQLDRSTEALARSIGGLVSQSLTGQPSVLPDPQIIALAWEHLHKLVESIEYCVAYIVLSLGVGGQLRR